MAIFAIKCVSGTSDQLKLAVFAQKTRFLTFSENFIFGLFWLVFPTLGSILGAQTCSNQPRHEASIGRGHPKEFFGP